MIDLGHAILALSGLYSCNLLPPQRPDCKSSVLYHVPCSIPPPVLRRVARTEPISPAVRILRHTSIFRPSDWAVG